MGPQQVSDHEISRITITRVLTDEGRDLVDVTATDSGGGRLAVIEALGLLQLAIYDVCNAPADEEDE